MRRPPFLRAYCLEIVKLGLVTEPPASRPSARPRVKVVLPAPTSPMSSMTIVFLAGPASFSFSEIYWFKGLSEGLLSDEKIRLANCRPYSSISCSEWIIIV